MAFLYTSIELSGRETKKTIPFTIATTMTKNEVPKNTFKQGDKDLYLENYGTLNKETEEDTNK